MEMPDALRDLLDKVVSRVRDDASTALSRTQSSLAQEYAGRGIRGGPLVGAQTAAVSTSANDEASRTVAEVLRIVREAYGGTIPDELGEPLREYLIGQAKTIGSRVNALVLMKTKDLTIGNEIASRLAAVLVRNMVRDIEIELGSSLLRQQLRTLQSVVAQPAAQHAAYDVFVSHASEDKADFVDELVAELKERGLRVWYDKAVLTIGDMLSAKIADGLQRSRFGVVVLSPHFFKKQWPARELNALACAEAGDGRKRVLPVWHGVDQVDVARYNTLLAGVLGVSSSNGARAVVDEIMRALDAEASHSSVGRDFGGE